MTVNKAKPGDEALIHDETQDWVERSSALSRLAADGRLALEPVARAWLHGDDDDLAIEALSMLLTYWRDSPEVRTYLATALEWLDGAENREKRASAAGCLATFLSRSSECRDEIMRAWLVALEHDEDSVVQENCYRGLLQQLAPAEAKAFPRAGQYFFDRATDVRWELLEPLRARLGRAP